MKTWLVAFFAAASLSIIFAADDLPLGDEAEPLEIEPPLLMQNFKAEGTLPNIDTPGTAGGDMDIAQLESDLARAKKNAAAGERLYKSGILAKVEAEERALKVTRIDAKLAAAQLEEAQRKLDDAKSQSVDDGTLARELQAAETLVAETAQRAQAAADERRRAEVEAAARNVERQQKLLALGSARKADVHRAEEKLAELKETAR